MRFQIIYALCVNKVLHFKRKYVPFRNFGTNGKMFNLQSMGLKKIQNCIITQKVTCENK